MIRRPKATDTEEDLLSLQESFLASGELPSASLHRVSKPGAGRARVQVGEKRREHAGGGEEEWRDQPAGRDVVQLHPKGQCHMKCVTNLKKPFIPMYATCLIHVHCITYVRVACMCIILKIMM